MGSSQSEGHNMVNRLLTDFHAGNNRFDAPGEALFAYIDGNVVVAIAGLNLEPGLSLGSAGRVRRMYVIPRCRGNGLARSLVEEIASLASLQRGTAIASAASLRPIKFIRNPIFTPASILPVLHALRGEFSSTSGLASQTVSIPCEPKSEAGAICEPSPTGETTRKQIRLTPTSMSMGSILETVSHPTDPFIE